VRRQAYGTKVDVWSAGVLGYKLICGHHAFEGHSRESLEVNILHTPLHFLWTEFESVRLLLLFVVRVCVFCARVLRVGRGVCTFIVARSCWW
jgi:hypothetical protein